MWVLHEWEEILKANFTGTFLFCQAAGKVMIQQEGERSLTWFRWERFGKPEEVVGAALYLASDASIYVTGQSLFVDEGWLSY